MRFLTAASLLLAAPLLSPIIASAQKSPPAKATPQKVPIQFAFFPVAIADLDALGITPDFVSVSAPRGFSLRYIKGNPAAQLYRTLTGIARTHGAGVSLAPVVAADNHPTAIKVDVADTDYTYHPQMSNGPVVPPRMLGTFQLQGKLVLAPHVNSGNLVSIDIFPAGGGRPIRLKAIVSREPLAIVLPNVRGTKIPILSDVFRLPDSLPNTEEFLIFITPTILSAGANDGTMNSKP